MKRTDIQKVLPSAQQLGLTDRQAFEKKTLEKGSN